MISGPDEVEVQLAYIFFWKGVKKMTIFQHFAIDLRVNC